MTVRRSRCRRRRQGSEIPGGREILRGEFENSIKIGSARQRRKAGGRSCICAQWTMLENCAIFPGVAQKLTIFLLPRTPGDGCHLVFHGILGEEQLEGASADAQRYWQGRFAACAFVGDFLGIGRTRNSWGVAPNPTRDAVP